MWNVKLLLGLVAVTALCVSTIGCTNERTKLIDRYTAGNIKKMAIIYEAYTGNHKFQGPSDEAELRQWVMSEDCSRSKMERVNINVEKFDEYMISERTGEKFEIRWGVKSAPMGPPRPVIFETTAVEGIRQVGLAGSIDVLDVETDEEYDELMSGIYVPDDIERYPNRFKKRKKKK